MEACVNLARLRIRQTPSPLRRRLRPPLRRRRSRLRNRPHLLRRARSPLQAQVPSNPRCDRVWRRSARHYAPRLLRVVLTARPSFVVVRASATWKMPRAVTTKFDMLSNANPRQTRVLSVTTLRPRTALRRSVPCRRASAATRLWQLCRPSAKGFLRAGSGFATINSASR